uniref:Retrotransposon protein, putative, unclassified n=2 Tax=Oryza sativa subsp. japonica TaxID=39947 RepID=Q6ATN0_ORYSJ|nr:hypothetical protein [Oryza sativa Japonica Group]ABF96665.1 retrotransposon protein, putative, unclassified [Oryza sativa Japonica Group]
MWRRKHEVGIAHRQEIVNRGDEIDGDNEDVAEATTSLVIILAMTERDQKTGPGVAEGDRRDWRGWLVHGGRQAYAQAACYSAEINAWEARCKQYRIYPGYAGWHDGDIWKSTSLKRKREDYLGNSLDDSKQRKNPISLGKTTEMTREKVEHCCRWNQEEEIMGIAESLEDGGSGVDSSGGLRAVYLSTNPVQHQWTKYVEIDLHFVRDRVAAGAVRVLHVPTTSQFADIFTKGLPTTVFSESRSSLNVRQADAVTAGGC